MTATETAPSTPESGPETMQFIDDMAAYPDLQAAYDATPPSQRIQANAVIARLELQAERAAQEIERRETRPRSWRRPRSWF